MGCRWLVTQRTSYNLGVILNPYEEKLNSSDIFWCRPLVPKLIWIRSTVSEIKHGGKRMDRRTDEHYLLCVACMRFLQIAHAWISDYKMCDTSLYYIDSTWHWILHDFFNFGEEGRKCKGTEGINKYWKKKKLEIPGILLYRSYRTWEWTDSIAEYMATFILLKWRTNWTDLGHLWDRVLTLTASHQESPFGPTTIGRVWFVMIKVTLMLILVRALLPAPSSRHSTIPFQTDDLPSIRSFHALHP